MKKKKNTRRSTKRSRCRFKKDQQRTYRIRNWSQYNAALVARGSLTIWVEQDLAQSWFHQQASGRRGASLTYSDAAILLALTLKAVYHLPLRATQGFLASVLKLLGLELAVPDYSTLCRRQASLEVALPRRASQLSQEGVHLVMDATGLKVFGEGEWKVRQHGYSKRRTWRKLHLGVDEASGLILAAELTRNNVGDSAVAGDLLEEIPERLKQFSGDGAYDARRCYEALAERQRQPRQKGQPIRVTIPPQKGARIWRHGNRKGERLARDENLRRIRQVGKAEWKQESGYHRRSLAETAMFRYKTILGEKLSSRDFARQATEALIGCRVLNRMTELGMPASYVV